MDVNPQNLMLCRDGIMKEVNVDPKLSWNDQDWQFADVCEDHGGRLNVSFIEREKFILKCRLIFWFVRCTMFAEDLLISS